MDYCRFTDESDVYAFQEGAGVFMVVVAVSRLSTTLDEAAHETWGNRLEEGVRESLAPIGGRFDGQTFEEDSPWGLFRRLRDLASVGYRIEPDAWEKIHHCHPELGLDGSGLLRPRKATPRP